MKPLILGVAGGTGSGKTTVAHELTSILEKDGRSVLVIAHDYYYKDQKDVPMSIREKTNYDHPDSLETDLLVEHLLKLKEGQSVELPLYDFATHTRKSEVQRASSAEIVIVEGILLYAHAKLTQLLDFKVFVDTPDDIRFIRRLKRDTAERGRNVESVIEQYLQTVRPMHMQFVEPTKRVADLVVAEGGYNLTAMQLLTDHIREMID